MIEPSVICYFPGSGGNRLARYLLGKSWNQRPGTAAHGDIPVPEVNYQDRDTRPYPTKTTHIIQRPHLIELTHCMNSNLVSWLFPGRKIIKIKCQLSWCLSRHWVVHGRIYHRNLIASHNAAFAISKEITWHKDYYDSTGIDWTADKIWDLSADQEFCNWMRNEIENCQDRDFHTAL